jgi:phosphatidylglycerophosphate synthase
MGGVASGRVRETVDVRVVQLSTIDTRSATTGQWLLDERDWFGDETAMLDQRLRPWIDRRTATGARWLRNRGVTADRITLSGLALGLLGAAAIALGQPLLGLALFLLNRLGDGLDGAAARMDCATDRGGYLDIVADFLVYAAVPLAFAVADPARNALTAAVLLAAFIANGVAFLAFAVLAEKRGLETRTQGPKSFYFLAGLAEGFETIVAFALMCIFPEWFAMIAMSFAGLCFVSAVARIAMAWRVLG